MAQPQADQKLAGLVRAEIGRAEVPHRHRETRWRKLDKVYGFKLEPARSKWRHDLHPPFALQLIDQINAAIVDDQPKSKVKPLDSEDECVKAARAWEFVLDRQRKRVGYAREWNKFVKQGLVRGFTVAKIPWVQESATIRERVFDPTGRESKPRESERIILDQPKFVTLSVYDNWWDPAAGDIDDVRYWHSRFYSTPEQLAAMEDDGVYRNTAEVKGTSTGGSDAKRGRKLEGFVEIIERWTRDSLTVIANREVILQDGPNPFWHNHIPFVCASPIPAIPDYETRTLDGWSVTELIADQQSELWMMMNQRLDNNEIFSNAVLKVMDTEPDIEKLYNRFPGEVIPVTSPNAIMWDTPPTSIMEASMQAEAQLKQDMAQLAGSVQQAAGAAEGTVDPGTATGISLLQSTAQKRMQAMKQMFAYAEQDAGDQWIALNQNLLSRPEKIVEQTPEGPQSSWIEPASLVVQKVAYVVEDIAESLNQQTRRAEAAVKLTMLMNASQLPQLAQQLNLRRAIEDFSEAYGDERDAFLSPGGAAAPAAPPSVVPPGSGPGVGQPPATMPPTPGSPAGGAGAPTPTMNGQAA